MSSSAGFSYKSAVKRGLKFKNDDPLWIAIGRTEPWPNEASPPAYEPGADDIDTPIVFVRPTILTMARVVSEADYNAAPDGQKAKVTIDGTNTFVLFVADEDAREQYARFVYYRGEFNPVQGIPVAPFRQTAIYSELVPAAGYEGANWLAPEHVQERGLLEYHDNAEFVNMSPSGPVVAVHGVLDFQ